MRPAAFAVVAFTLTFTIAGLEGRADGRPSVADALKLRPIQPDIEFDRPTSDQVDGCKLQAERAGASSGWIVVGPAGQALRRFVDSNGDDRVDLWCYFRQGVEVYRDVDGDFNGKADQYQWLGTAGVRWGLDENEDGRIDRWRRISPEEVTSEIVEALRTRDERRLKLVLLQPAELRELDLLDNRQRQLAQRVEAANKGLAGFIRGQKLVSSEGHWIHFAASRPGALPVGAESKSKELLVYENAMTLVSGAGGDAQIHVGTLIKVGDAWKAVELPMAVEDNAEQLAARAIFFSPLRMSDYIPGELTAGGGVGDEGQRLEALAAIDQELARQTNPAKKAVLHDRRAKALLELMGSAPNQAQRLLWGRQLTDVIGAAAQSGEFPEGIARLKQILGGLDPQRDQVLRSHLVYTILSTEYNQRLSKPDADFEEVQAEWKKSLEKFVEEYPDAEDTPDAMMQLAVATEFEAEEATAKQWYGKIAQEFPDTTQGRKAQGAVRRLSSVGQRMELSGPTLGGNKLDVKQLRGKVLLIDYWATWCEPCVNDFEPLAKLVEQYGGAFAVVGVNLDANRQDAVDYLQRRPTPWTHLHEEGGLDSRLAQEMGIVTLPTKILVNAEGVVVRRNIHVAQLAQLLAKANEGESE